MDTTFGVLCLIPPIVAIVLALVTKQTVFSLFVAVWLGSTMINGYNPLVGFVKIISEKYPDADIIAGVATGAIAHGALVADRLNKPFVYVRSSPKSHGLNNQVEGECWQNAKVVVIEDLVSTGGSSLCAVEALRETGCDVLGMVAIFTYEFSTAKENFAAADVHLDTLSNYSTMIELAVQQGYVHADELQTLQEWRRDPANWKK